MKPLKLIITLPSAVSPSQRADFSASPPRLSWCEKGLAWLLAELQIVHPPALLPPAPAQSLETTAQTETHEALRNNQSVSSFY